MTPRLDPTSTEDDDLTLALLLADAADAVSLPRFRAADLHVETKPDRTPVTDADRAVEQRLREVLETERPHDGFYGEESGSSGDSERRWIIDPIDGTANFLRGVPVWATLISLTVEGEAVVGVVSAPALGRRWWASRGEGAWTAQPGTGDRRLGVSAVSALEDASVSFQSIRQWDDAGRLDTLIALTRRVWRDRAYGDMWSYMLLAEGVLDAVAEFDLKPYDMAALIPIVEEAGGRFSGSDGSPGPFTDGSAVATNGHLHDALLSQLAP